MKALKTALVIAITGVAISFASQAKATTDCHPIMLSFWSTNKPYPSGMAPLFDEKCNFIKYIPVSGNVSFVAPMPNAVTTTIPVTTTTTVKPKATESIPQKVTSVSPPRFFGSIGAVGAICADGWRSYSAGSGTCSWHGGVRNWEYYNPVIINFPPIKPIVIKPIEWSHLKITCVGCG